MPEIVNLTDAELDALGGDGNVGAREVVCAGATRALALFLEEGAASKLKIGLGVPTLHKKRGKALLGGRQAVVAEIQVPASRARAHTTVFQRVGVCGDRHHKGHKAHGKRIQAKGKDVGGPGASGGDGGVTVEEVGLCVPVLVRHQDVESNLVVGRRAKRRVPRDRTAHGGRAESRRVLRAGAGSARVRGVERWEARDGHRQGRAGRLCKCEAAHRTHKESKIGEHDVKAALCWSAADRSEIRNGR
jgi:hypothetical protein